MQVVAEHPVEITNPDKLLWPERGVTKATFIKYLIDVSPWLLPHLQSRPLTVIRYPDGIHGHGFYQRNAPRGTPDWVRTTPSWSEDRKDVIHYVVVDSLSTLIWLGNLACLEFHVGFTTLMQTQHPTAVAFDLDPTVPGFDRVREVALALHRLLNRLGLPHIPKTSGATGLQVFIPLVQGHSYEDTRIFTKAIAQYLLSQLPGIVTLERLTRNREDKVYIDYPQHGASRTLIAPYSPRARANATVSTPLQWEELERGATPEEYTVFNVPQRLNRIGDPLAVHNQASLHEITQFLQRHPQSSL